METDFLRALATANGRPRYARIGNARFLGAALRIEAEAHSGLGNSRTCGSCDLRVSGVTR